ncbi:hypothetical protein N9W28_04365 [Alphaproteobacteria bacterium]|nr:hypothetical protein [Alphaproteobacteria bacterium]
MKFFLIFLSILTPNILKANFEEDIAFQLQAISQNNLITEIEKQQDLVNLIEQIEYKDNFFYSLFDPLTNSDIFPKYSDRNEFFFEKIKLFSNKVYGFQINSNLFEKVLFENFQDPELNQAYLQTLFRLNQIENLCEYLGLLDTNQKNFDNAIEFNIICLLNNKQNQQISLLLEIYNDDEFKKLNTTLLLDYLNKKQLNDEFNLSELGMIDLFILSMKNDAKIYVENISNLFELELYRKSNELKLYEVNFLFKKRIINNSQYLSLLSNIKDKPKELLMFNEISEEINYNKRLAILEKYIPEVQLDLYDLSRLIYNQFREMRITSRNLKYINALIILSLYENSSFLENLKVVLTEISDENLEDDYLALGLKRYLTNNTQSELYSDDKNDLKSPLMRFFFLNGDLKFTNLDKSLIEENKDILVDPIYLFNLSENFNLIESYIYYIQLSEDYYSLNEFDLYFINKYLINNEYLKNEFIKLFFKVHLSNL